MNYAFDTRQPEQVDDLEVVAYIVRLCRAAPPFTKGAKILADARIAFAGIDETRLKSCAETAVTKLIEQGGYTLNSRKTHYE